MTAHFMGSDAAGATFGGRNLLMSFVNIFLYLIVIASIIAFTSYAVLSQLSMQYRAETTILIAPADSRSGANVTTNPDAGTVSPELLAAQLQLLRSGNLARTVVQSLGLEHRQAFVEALENRSVLSDFLSGIGLKRDPTGIALEERLLETFAARLSVSSYPDAPVIAVGFTSGDPQLAADVANAVAAEYIALHHAARGDAAEEATSWLEAEIDNLRHSIAALESKAEAYRAGIGQLSSAASAASGLARKERAEAQLGAELREIEGEAARQRDLLYGYESRYRDALARRQNGSLPADARILSPASAPTEPSFPRKGPITAMLGVLALAIMAMFVVVRRLARRRQPGGLAQIPLPEVADSGLTEPKARWFDDRGVRRIMPAPTLVDREVGGPISDSTTAVVRRLIRDAAGRIMVVTIGTPLGKRRPLAAVALARALARADRRPVLIDLHDDRADSLSMGEGADLPGFSDLLAGDASFGQVIFRDRKSRVHFIPAGQRMPHRQDLADERVELLVNALDHTYDHVVFDVGADMAGAIGPGCGAAVVASEFPGDDPRVALAVKQLRVHSKGPVVVFTIGPETADAISIGGENAAGGKAA